MASFTITDAFVTIGGTDLSDHLTSITLSVNTNNQENTAMGSTWKDRIPSGVNDWSLSLEFNQDYAASNVDATLWAALGVSTAVVIRPTSAAASATNPQYSGNALLEGYNPLDGAMEDVAKVSPTFVADGALTRATA